MPHQKSTVLSVCLIYRRSAYLEAIVIQHCRLFTYFSGIVPSYRVRKWVNWYADCLSLKPFQNQLCHWFSVGACIPFLNVMRCSAWVRWGGCANLTRDQSWFSYWQDFHGIQWKFTPGPDLQAEFLCLHHLLFANHVGYMWLYRCLCLSLLSSLGCVLPLCAFVEKAAKVFPSHLGRARSHVPSTWHISRSHRHCLRHRLPRCRWHWTRIIIRKRPKFSHTHGRVCCFFFFLLYDLSFQQEIVLQKIKATCLFNLLSSHSYLVFLLGFFLAVRMQVSQALSAEPGFAHPQKLF